MGRALSDGEGLAPRPFPHLASSSPTLARPGCRALLTPAVIVGALGYFVDIYDLLLFSIVRLACLCDLGFTGEDLLAKGSLLLNLQMAGIWLLFGVLAGGFTTGMLWPVAGICGSARAA